LYEQQGDWTNAVANYGQALRRGPGLAASGFWQADPARSARWPDFIKAAVGQLPAEGQGELDLRLELALAQADFEAAETLIGPMTAPTSPELRLKLAELYLRQGQPERAEPLLQADPITGQDYLLAGWLKLQLGRPAEAEKLFKTAVFLGNGAANYYLGQLYEQQGNLPAAELAYRRGFSPRSIAEDVAVTIYGRPAGLDLAPQVLRLGVGAQQAESWLALARLLEAQQRLAEAQQIYQLLLAEDPFLEVARQRLALIGSPE
jgi:tetratricopeptide (TPR) repeat protein